MPCTTTQTGRPRRVDDENIYDRLNWLIAANNEASRRKSLRQADDEEQVLQMRRPVSTGRAYALFGTLLGALGPTAFFLRFLLDFLPAYRYDKEIIYFWLALSIVCVTVGGIAGARIGQRIDRIEREPVGMTILLAGFYGLCWSILTGAAGGAISYRVGAVTGASFAAPIGILGFVLFTLLHRLVARGGMIDARHLWPLACGVSMFIAAFILGR
jgi:hypothetical protein